MASVGSVDSAGFPGPGTMGTTPSSLEHEYDAYLASLAQEMAAVGAEGPSEERRATLARLDLARTEFVLQAAPILARCYRGGESRQALYEELATLTANVEAIARIREARLRREDALAAARRGPNDRKRRVKGQVYTTESLVCSTPGCGGNLVVFKTMEVVCERCGTSRGFETAAPMDGGLAFGDRAPASESSYSKQTHLAELLQNVQGKERTEVPSDVVDAVRTELRKHKQLEQPQKITALVVRGHLRRLGLAHWYDHAQQIAMTASDNRCPRVVLPPELERDLHAAFALIIEPFKRAIRGYNRTNFLSYSYFAYKRSEINGFSAYKRHFRLLKNQQKTAQCDRWWKSVCEEVGWPFRPTV